MHNKGEQSKPGALASAAGGGGNKGVRTTRQSGHKNFVLVEK